MRRPSDWPSNRIRTSTRPAEGCRSRPDSGRTRFGPAGSLQFRERPDRERPVRERPDRERPVREPPVRERPVRERPGREPPARERPGGESPGRGTALACPDPIRWRSGQSHQLSTHWL
jgi:hypothetical protein